MIDLNLNFETHFFNHFNGICMVKTDKSVRGILGIGLPTVKTVGWNGLIDDYVYSP